MFISQHIVEKARPDAAILLAFVVAPMVIIGGILGEYKLALFLSLPGLISEAIGLGGYIKTRLLRQHH